MTALEKVSHVNNMLNRQDRKYRDLKIWFDGRQQYQIDAAIVIMDEPQKIGKAGRPPEATRKTKLSPYRSKRSISVADRTSPFARDDEDEEEGWRLICIGGPLSDVVLDA